MWKPAATPIADARVSAKADLLDGQPERDSSSRPSIGEPRLNRKADELIAWISGAGVRGLADTRSPAADSETSPASSARRVASDSSGVVPDNFPPEARPAAELPTGDSAPTDTRGAARDRGDRGLRDARIANALFDAAGIDPRSVWGDRPADDIDRRHAEHVVATVRFPKAVEQRMVAVASDFALSHGGRGDPGSFADLYEYAAAHFAGERRAATAAGARKREAVEQATGVLLSDPDAIGTRLAVDRARADDERS